MQTHTSYGANKIFYKNNGKMEQLSFLSDEERDMTLRAKRDRKILAEKGLLQKKLPPYKIRVGRVVYYCNTKERFDALLHQLKQDGKI